MSWISKYWPYLGLLLAIAMRLRLGIAKDSLSELESLLGLHFIILVLHQFEEYKLPGGFKTFFNSNILNKTRILRIPLSDLSILMVNVVIAWWAYVYSAYHSELYGFALGLAGITVINGLLHIIVAIVQRKYNPGLVTSLFLFIPFGGYLISKLLPYLSSTDWATGISIFLIGTAAIPLGIALGFGLRPD